MFRKKKAEEAPKKRRNSQLLAQFIYGVAGWALFWGVVVTGGSYVGNIMWDDVFSPKIDRAVYAVAEWRGHDFSPVEPEIRETLVYVPEPLPMKVDENNPCVLAIRMLAPKYNVPVVVALTVAHTESRFNPKAVNRNTNGSVDRGCMQINGTAHPKAFARPDDAFVAVINVDYGLRFLRDLYQETGDWRKAIVKYNSRTPAKQTIYRGHLNRSSHALMQKPLEKVLAGL